MKSRTIKTTIYIAFASLLVMSCVRINNVKLIMDNHALLGFELDLSEAEFSFRGTAATTSDTDIATSVMNEDESASRP